MADHKLYFVPVGTLDEAKYLTGILNAPTITAGIGAYAAQLSLGVSVIENLKLPAFDADNEEHQEIARIAGEIADRDGIADDQQFRPLDELAYAIVSRHR